MSDRETQGAVAALEWCQQNYLKPGMSLEEVEVWLGSGVAAHSSPSRTYYLMGQGRDGPVIWTCFTREGESYRLKSWHLDRDKTP